MKKIEQVKLEQDSRVSPDMIRNLNAQEIFVFGSNLQGMHGGGAARVAVSKFGAIMGQGVGIQGQSYAGWCRNNPTICR